MLSNLNVCDPFSSQQNVRRGSVHRASVLSSHDFGCRIPSPTRTVLRKGSTAIYLSGVPSKHALYGINAHEESSTVSEIKV